MRSRGRERGVGVKQNERQVTGGAKEMLSCCFWVVSDLCAFGQFQCVLYVNSKTSHRAIVVGMTKEYLNGTGLPVAL